MTDKYPQDRKAYFAQKVTRLLVKTCAAQEMGQTAALLVITVAATEDAARYRRAVTFYNDQLIPLVGVKKWHTLDRARRSAIEAGWLHYEAPPSGGRKPGRYWVTIPSYAEGLEDSPVDESGEEWRSNEPTCPPEASPLNGDGTPEASPLNGYPPPKAPSPNGDGMGDGMGEPSYLSLSLKKEEQQFELFEKEKKDKPKPNGQVTPDKFDLFWSVVHKRIGKVPARKAYENAVKRIKKESPEIDPDQHLYDRMKLFASSPEGDPKEHAPIHPARWLNDGRYDDDEDTWFEHGGPMEDEKLSYGINQPKRNARPPAPPGPER